MAMDDLQCTHRENRKVISCDEARSGGDEAIRLDAEHRGEEASARIEVDGAAVERGIAGQRDTC